MDVPSTSADSTPQVSHQGPTVESQPPGAWSRPRAVATACERCRRRKIRCDGDTPCATCRRFSIVCIRHRKGQTQTALEQRIHELEEQVATLSSILSGIQSNSVVEDLPLLPPFPIDPISTDSITCPFEYPPVGSPVHGEDAPVVDVPQIQVVECANLSPMPMAMSPSIVPVASRPGIISTNMDARLMPMQLETSITPPLSASSSPTWDARCSLSPERFALSSPTPTPSLSSLALDPNLDHANAFPSEGTNTLTEMQGICASAPGERPGILTVSTRAKAEGLLNFICEKAPGLGVPLSRESLLILLNTLCEHSESSASTNRYSASMARFQVYMAMAAALSLRSDVRGGDNQLLDHCYQLAVDQIQSSQFWTQPRAHEAALLVVLFARATQESLGFG